MLNFLEFWVIVRFGRMVISLRVECVMLLVNFILLRMVELINIGIICVIDVEEEGYVV